MCLFNPINTIYWAITVISVDNDIVTFSDWVLTVIWTASIVQCIRIVFK